MADNFSKKYGVKATGIKVSASSQLEMIIREAQAKNVQGDVVLITDAPAGLAQLLPEKFVESWLPPDMKDKIPAQFQNPLAITTNANVWAYNTEVYEDMPGEEHLGADGAEVEGQGRVLRSAVEGHLPRLVQPDGDARRRQDGGRL